MKKAGWRFWNGYISQELLEDCVGPVIDWEAEHRKAIEAWDAWRAKFHKAIGAIGTATVAVPTGWMDG